MHKPLRTTLITGPHFPATAAAASSVRARARHTRFAASPTPCHSSRLPSPSIPTDPSHHSIRPCRSTALPRHPSLPSSHLCPPHAADPALPHPVCPLASHNCLCPNSCPLPSTHTYQPSPARNSTSLPTSGPLTPTPSLHFQTATERERSVVTWKTATRRCAHITPSLERLGLLAQLSTGLAHLRTGRTALALRSPRQRQSSSGPAGNSYPPPRAFSRPPNCSRAEGLSLPDNRAQCRPRPAATRRDPTPLQLTLQQRAQSTPCGSRGLEAS